MQQPAKHREKDRELMQRAINLASRGTGFVSPNPLVGCVIVSSDGVILGEGYHQRYGEAHAEVNAIRDAEKNGNDVSGATVYVTLEPCSHYGKQPPCADMLIEKGISRCVVATGDLYREVNGKGIAKLRAAGIHVELSVCEEEARELNRFFLKYVTTALPYITMKIAASLDGKSALRSGKSQWITSEASRNEVHKMRAAYDAVMVASATVIADDPELSVRNVDGRNPKRIILDAGLRVPDTAKVVSDANAAYTYLVTSSASIRDKGDKIERLASRGVQIVEAETTKGHLDLEDAFRKLAQQKITSILVEPGPTIATVLYRDKLFDELVLFLAPMVLGGDALSAFGDMYINDLVSVEHLRLIETHGVEGSNDILIRYRKK